MSHSSPPRALLSAVALVAASILLFEIALTRVFGTVLRYHLSFLAISIALCGLGVGGFATHWIRGRKPLSLGSLGGAYALATVGALLLLLRVVLARAPEQYWLSALVVLVPFSLGGAWLAEAFARFPRYSGRLYAWDLGGAALSALLAVPILNLLPAPAAVVAAAAIGAAGAALAIENPRRERWVIPVGLCILLLLLGSTTGRNVRALLDVPPLPPKPDQFGLTLAQRGVTQDLFTELGTPGNKSSIVETRHNAFARTDVVDDPLATGGDGFLIYTNGNVPTNMMRWDGRVASLPAITNEFPLSDWSFAAARLKRPGASVFSIGPGGGLDALLALRHGASRFEGAEINPSILDIMDARHAMNGDIYDKVNVRVKVADGRAFAVEALARGKKYDLIFSALTKTATTGQGMALLESFIHTSEAFTDYWNLLKPGGQATIVLDQPILLARFVATWLQVLGEQGIEARQAMRHIAIVADSRPGPYRLSLVVQKSPFSPAQGRELFQAANLRGLDAVWIPDNAALNSYGPYAALASGELSPAQFVSEYRERARVDISPRPDDRPFVLDLGLDAPPSMHQLALLAAVLSVALATAGLLSSRAPQQAQVLEEDARGADEEKEKGEIEAPQVLPVGAAPVDEDGTRSQVLASDLARPRLGQRFEVRDAVWVAYFLALGVGFMMVEIPLAQTLILPLGYPTLALSVILFAVLLGGGAGSWASQRFEGARLSRYAAACAVGVALGAALVPSLVQALARSLPLWPLGGRVALAVALLLPLGFVLGTPFPSGLRLFAQRHPHAVPLVWGLNGVASVVGSLCAALGARAFGFSQTLMLGAAIYLVAALGVWWLGRGEGQEEAPAS